MCYRAQFAPFRTTRCVCAAGIKSGGELCNPVLPAPIKSCRDNRYTQLQVAAIAQYVVGGGSLLVLGDEGSVTSSQQQSSAEQSYASLNNVLKPYGITFNLDVVLRTMYHTYLHPKEAFIAKGCVSPAFSSVVAELHARNRAAMAVALGGAAAANASQSPAAHASSDGAGGASIEFVYPRGCTLAVTRPANVLLASGHACYPVQRPLAAVWENSKQGGGRVAVIGSSDMLRDAWIVKEHNGAIGDALFRWLATGRRAIRLNSTAGAATAAGATTAARPSLFRNVNASGTGTSPSTDTNGRSSNLYSGGGGAEGRDTVDALLSTITQPTSVASASSGGGGKDANGDAVSAESSLHPRLGDEDVPDNQFLPDTAALAERLRCCLQEPEPLPKDVYSMFDSTLMRFGTASVPEAVVLYGTLAVKHEPLTLIPPQFTPMPLCTPAVFPPIQRELPPPALELFDLDEQFASERSRLAQLTNKCTDEDLDYFVRECGIVCGVMVSSMPHILRKHARAHMLVYPIPSRIVAAAQAAGGVSKRKGRAPVGAFVVDPVQET